MDISVHNTLTGKKEVFVPLKKGQVTMYNCGPTVYDYAHIGNLRSYVFADVLRRMFEYNGYVVNQVINITDIGHLSGDGDEGEDKMTKALKREGKPMTLSAMREVADFYFEKFKDDLSALNIELPTHFPFASDHIAEDIEIIKKLSEKGFTYTTSDGIYFDTSKFPEYGKLGNQVASDNAPTSAQSSGEAKHSRIGVNPEKKNARDFALWKFSSVIPALSRNPETKAETQNWMPDQVRHDDTTLGYDAPFGKGFPGWHIECSAMSRKYLGQPFDIHTGGIDHIPVHHNNEIAQSESAYDTPLAIYWMHNAFLNIPKFNLPLVRNLFNKKMAKSTENFITLQTLIDEGIHPLAYRYLLLTARYSSPVNFSWQALEGAKIAWAKILMHVNELSLDNSLSDPEATKDYRKKFYEYINDDLDTPKALALVWEIIKNESISGKNKYELLLKFDKVLGLEINKTVGIEFPEDLKKFIKNRNIKVEIPTEIQKLIDERNTARAEKDFELSDNLRMQIENLGFVLKDTDSGTEVEKM
jgi:cysteinyl-tRNA synthetase